MGSSHLVYVVHCDPSMRARYVDALAAIGIAADVVPIVSDLGPADGLSSRYDALAAACRTLGKGVALRGLAQRHKPPRSLGDYERVIVACYSAGYAVARALDPASIAAIDALVLIDSGHTGLDAEGSANDAGVAWAVGWAREARAARKVLVIGHTDVDPIKYASTTKFAAEVVRLSGGELAELASDDLAAIGLVRRERAGLFAVESWNRRPAAQAQGEHGDALTVWGDDLVQYAAALCLALPSHGAAAEPPDAEPPPETRRTSRPPAGHGERLSHGWRCGVAELAADARALGRWHPAADVRAGRYVPRVGDLVVSTRPGGKHVERVVGVGPGKPTTLGGNESNTWICDSYDLGALAFEGMIEVEPEHGRLAVEVALEEYKAGVKETPGPKATPRIQEYHAGARRGGSPLAGMPGHESEGYATLGSSASDETAWCASSASWCAYQAEKRRA